MQRHSWMIWRSDCCDDGACLPGLAVPTLLRPCGVMPLPRQTAHLINDEGTIR